MTDVLDRQRFEDSLRERDLEFSAMQRLAQVGSWHWDPARDVVTWSEELYRIAGRDPRLPAVSYGDHGTLYTPESWARLQHAVAEALSVGTPYELDLEMVRPDGTNRWIRARGAAQRDEAGHVVALRGTVQDITERKRVEDTLRASEERFRSVFRDAGVGKVIVSPDGRFVAANAAFCQCLGYSEEELCRKTVESITHPDDWPEFSQRLQDALERSDSFQRFEKRCLHASGRVIWTESSASVINDAEGKPAYFVGEVLEITERKLAEEALSTVNRRLLEMQEQERARIARELHDDISQRLALLTIGMEHIKRDWQRMPTDAHERLNALAREVGEIASDVHAISYRLRSPKLEHLGLVPAVDGFCRESAAQQNVQIDFEHNDVPPDISYEVSLCLFRVLQESLHNAARHSGVQRFTVRLSGRTDEIALIVSDAGIGFDPNAARNRKGLGLVSMRERLQLVNGTIAIRSQPHGGTSIVARVPLTPPMHHEPGS